MTANRLMVYVRCKPLEDERPIIDIVDDQTLIFDPIDPENQPTNEYYYHGKKFRSIGSKKNKNSNYSFDKVFNDYATNYNIYESVTKPMVDATLNGLNCTVFAYGATGSGKTFTMLGRPTCPGVIYYTSKDLFGKLATISETDPLPPELRICYFEIYNEKIRDLLVFEAKNFFECGNKRLRTTPERCRARQQFLARDTYNLPVCEKPGDSAALVIPDLTYHTPTNAEELIELLEAGNVNRSQHPTDANADSSRSHAIFQIVLTRRTRRVTNSSTAEYQLQTSKISLIDLAGSERASVAYRAGNDRSKNLQREGGNINKSLLALGNCINALADPRKGHKHVPYRNSKLTRILRDSLGGRCKTAMIATVCQQASHYDDTQNTLMYASRAKCIKLMPGRNFTDIAIQPKNYSLVIDTQNKQIKTLQSQNDNLKFENQELKNEINTLRAYQQKQNSNHQTFITRSVDRSNFLAESNYRGTLEELYETRRVIKMEILNYESKYRENELKLTFKEIDEKRNQVINNNTPYNNNNNDHSKAIKTQLDFYESERIDLLKRAKSNQDSIDSVIVKMNEEFAERYGNSDDFYNIIEPYICERERLQELEEKIFCEQYAFDIAQTGMLRLVATEELLIESIEVIRYIHAVTKGSKLLSDSLLNICENKIEQLFGKLEGKKKVVWKDDKYAINESKKDNQPLLSIHDNFNLNFLTPFKNNNTLLSRRLSKNLVSLTHYTPEQNNITFDASQ